MNSQAPNNPLDQLKDIHLPGDASWFPPSLLTIVTLLVFITVIGFTVYGAIHFYQSRNIQRAANKQLHYLQQQELDDKSYVDAISQLLRRIAISRHAQLAGSGGNAWQQHLQHYMPSEQAQLIATARYQKQLPNIDRNALYKACQKYIKAANKLSPQGGQA